MPFRFRAATHPFFLFSGDIMSAALWFRRCLGFCIGMCFSSLGLALITNTNLGTTPITSLPVALNALAPLSIGGYTVIVSVLFIGVEKLILGKHFSLANILQMPPVFLFGLFIDCWMDVTAQVGLLPYWERLCVLLSGIAVLAAGINLQVVSNAVVLPGEGIVLALAFRTRHSFGSIKTLVDSSLVASAALVGWFGLGTVVGLREGTLVSALLTGIFARMLGSSVSRLAPLFAAPATADNADAPLKEAEARR